MRAPSRPRVGPARADKPTSLPRDQSGKTVWQEGCAHVFVKTDGQRGILVDAGYHDEPDILSEGGFAHGSTEGKAVHAGHDEVGDDHLRAIIHEHGEALLATRCLYHFRSQGPQPGIIQNGPFHGTASRRVIID